MATKHEERSSHFKPAKKQRLLDKQELMINIGLMEFNEEGLASPLRGKTLPQKIAKNADYKTVLAAALKKRQNFDKTFEPELIQIESVDTPMNWKSIGLKFIVAIHMPSMVGARIPVPSPSQTFSSSLLAASGSSSLRVSCTFFLET